jgi:hypothetical protein
MGPDGRIVRRPALVLDHGSFAPRPQPLHWLVMSPGSPHVVDGPRGYSPRCPRPRPGRVGPAGPARAGPGPRGRAGRRPGPCARAPPQLGLRSAVSYVAYGAAVAEISKSESSARNPSRHEGSPRATRDLESHLDPKGEPRGTALRISPRPRQDGPARAGPDRTRTLAPGGYAAGARHRRHVVVSATASRLARRVDATVIGTSKSESSARSQGTEPRDLESAPGPVPEGHAALRRAQSSIQASGPGRAGRERAPVGAQAGQVGGPGHAT